MHRKNQKGQVYTLTIHRGFQDTVFQSADKEKIWEAIGTTWAPYTVRDEAENIVDEFVQF